MYAAKAGGRGAVRVFHARMHDAARQRLQLASELADAAALGQLRVYYQRAVQLGTGRIVAVEAVLRWLHPERGVLLPAAFLRAAEDSGHLAELGHWMVRSAVAQLRAWRARLPDGFRVHLNLSTAQVRWPGFTRFLSDTLREHAVPPDRLAVAISEAAVLTDEARGVQTLADLQRLGVGVHLDDFGTGYSSISYLRTLPIDTVTIDPSLDRGHHHRPAAGSLRRGAAAAHPHRRVTGRRLGRAHPRPPRTPAHPGMRLRPGPPVR